jgi:hypothetical protein
VVLLSLGVILEDYFLLAVPALVVEAAEVFAGDRVGSGDQRDRLAL